MCMYNYINSFKYNFMEPSLKRLLDFRYDYLILVTFNGVFFPSIGFNFSDFLCNFEVV